jgi:hypothetical protein
MGSPEVHPEPVGRGILTLAIQGQADAIHRELADQPTGVPANFYIEVSGVPGYTLAEVQGARRHDGVARIHVQRLDGLSIDDDDEPMLVDVPPPLPELEVEDDSIEGKNGTRWYPAPGGLQPEVVEVDDAGDPVTRKVNTDRYNYALHCDCGNVRYAMKSSVHQVDRCRPCAAARRHEYQVAWQRKKRQSKGRRG